MNKNKLVKMLVSLDGLNLDAHDIKISIDSINLILITAFGQISGKPCSKDMISSEAPEITVSNIIFNTVQNLFDKDEASEDCILLKDVTLLTSSLNTITYPFLYVFADDIIAATIGDAD